MDGLLDSMLSIFVGMPKIKMNIELALWLKILTFVNCNWLKL